MLTDNETQTRDRQKDLFTVGVPPNTTTITIKIKDVNECSRPSVQKNIHGAVQRYLNKITNRR